MLPSIAVRVLVRTWPKIHPRWLKACKTDLRRDLVPDFGDNCNRRLELLRTGVQVLADIAEEVLDDIENEARGEA